MAQLDRFFQVLHERNAEDFRLASGESPVFSFDGTPTPASSSRPGTEQLLRLLGEVLGPERLKELDEKGAVAFRLERPGIPPMAGTARREGERLEAVFRMAHLAPPSQVRAPMAAEPAAPAEPLAPSPSPPEGSPPPASAAPLENPLVAEADPVPQPPAVDRPAESPPAAQPARVAAATAPDGPKEIDRLFRTMIDRGASDLHLCCGEQPILRIDGEIVRMDEEPALDADALVSLLDPITPPRNLDEYAACHDTDFAYEIPGVARFRANRFTDRKGPGGVFRVIPSKILTAEQLGLSDKLLELCQLTKGLVLVTGPTGSGKSTTLTAMIDHINKTRSDHVLTIEDPIEFVHENIKCLVNQREVATHTQSFKRALRAALREDPDIVLVGELRDLETIAIAIETAETGHLVFGTLHTTTAVSTIDRVIDQFPPEQQSQVRTMLSESLKAVIAQVLCKKKGGGRVAALEVLMGTASVANLIREGKTFQIPSIMQTGKKVGMVSLNDALLALVNQGLVAPEEAYKKCADKSTMLTALNAAGHQLAGTDLAPSRTIA